MFHHLIEILSYYAIELFFVSTEIMIIGKIVYNTKPLFTQNFF